MKNFTKADIIIPLILLIMCTGWVFNIISLYQYGLSESLGVFRAIGVFIFPVGSLLGFF